MKPITINPFRVYTAPEAEAKGITSDSYLAKLVKYIPAEIVAAYTAIRSFLLPEVQEVQDGLEKSGKELSDQFANTSNFQKSFKQDPSDSIDFCEVIEATYGSNYKAYLFAFIGLLVLTIIYKYIQLKDKTIKTKAYIQICFALLAFTVWVYAFGDVFVFWFPESYNHTLAAVVIILVTLFLPALEIFLADKIFRKQMEKKLHAK